MLPGGMAERNLGDAWRALPAGARAALEQQWAGLAAGGLPCGSAVADGTGRVLAAGRNHTYDPVGALETRLRWPLQHVGIAHAELNALALLPTESEHAALTLWATQHPCGMCAAAVGFIGLGKVVFLADDLSDDSPPGDIVSSRGQVPYQPFGDLLWWTISSLLFLYTPAVLAGLDARNLAMNRQRYPELVRLTLELAESDTLASAARAGASLPTALAPQLSALVSVAAAPPRIG